MLLVLSRTFTVYIPVVSVVAEYPLGPDEQDLLVVEGQGLGGNDPVRRGAFVLEPEHAQHVAGEGGGHDVGGVEPASLGQEDAEPLRGDLIQDSFLNRKTHYLPFMSGNPNR